MKLVTFGQYKGRPLHEVPVAYLLFMMTRIGIRREHPDVIGDYLNELADRLVGDFDGTLTELLAPVPVEVLAIAKIKKVEKARAKLAKLEAQREADRQTMLAARRSSI